MASRCAASLALQCRKSFHSANRFRYDWSQTFRPASSCAAGSTLGRDAFASRLATAAVRGPSAISQSRGLSIRSPVPAAKGALTGITGTAVAGVSRASRSSLINTSGCSRVLPWLIFQRAYNCEAMIPWRRVRGKVIAQEIKSRKARARNHAETMRRFRLTRFGWERRRAGLRGKKKRKLSREQRLRAKRIEYVHRVDMHKLKKTVPYMRLKFRDFPKDKNPNVRPERLLVPAHFG
eukprot:TRINITY_DN57221_c0_g1_i1.p1 TRINITY_DN57221_c0_g1~~TRINITY_DN57221_c0_g1_i1.p1  ORF type:complete len:258 (+),score=27.89 TRINITY_DN57221_c0_g1_i1:67-774(+)